MKFILLLLISFIWFVVPRRRCRILVLEGGGDRGAFHAGAFDSLVKNLPESEVAYDVITGISVGSINALFLSFFAKGDEKKRQNT